MCSRRECPPATLQQSRHTHTHTEIEEQLGSRKRKLMDGEGMWTEGSGIFSCSLRTVCLAWGCWTLPGSPATPSERKATTENTLNPNSAVIPHEWLTLKNPFTSGHNKKEGQSELHLLPSCVRLVKQKPRQQTAKVWKINDYLCSSWRNKCVKNIAGSPLQNKSEMRNLKKFCSVNKNVPSYHWWAACFIFASNVSFAGLKNWFIQRLN